MIKVGAITIGQSPRTDVTQDILPLLGDQVELLHSTSKPIRCTNFHRPFCLFKTVEYSSNGRT